MHNKQDYLEKVILNQPQIEAIKRDLKIECREFLQRKIDHINGVCSYYRFIKLNRTKIPDIRSARENLAAIIYHSKALKTVLGTTPVGLYYTGFRGHEQFVDNHIAKTAGSEQLLLNNTIAVLTGIIAQAEKLAVNDDVLRRFYLLPTSAQKNSNLETTCLWPQLFDLYFEVRKTITFSPDGPLVRFVTTIHEALGIEAPSSSTIRTAVPTWKASRRADR